MTTTTAPSPQAHKINPISADSHVTEPPNCFIDHIERRYRGIAPYIEHVATGSDQGDAYVIEGIKDRVPLGLVAAAGIEPDRMRVSNTRFTDLHLGGWNPQARIRDQERDGIAGEVLYPSVGMVLCGHPDHDYKSACLWAYNRWLEEFISVAPDRLFGLGMTAIRSVPEAIEDFRRIKEMGFKGVMMPGYPGTEEDYDDPIFDPLWRAAVQLDLPISFHILAATDQANALQVGKITRGPKINSWQTMIRGCQDIIGMFIFGRVFDRQPDLKLVCVEADAGWAPHYMYRLDHAYKRHRAWLKCPEMAKLPSEYFRENVYLTFQDDWIALRMMKMCNARRLMWANDFPHSDSTWPNSQDLLEEQVGHLDSIDRERILRDNVRDLYRLA